MAQGGIAHRIEKAVGPDKQWVIPQLILLLAAAIGTPLLREASWRPPGWLRAGALPLLLAAMWIAGRAKADLSESFTMSPTPVSDGAMVEHGVYGVIRHPMYLSVLLALAGYAAAWRSGFGVLSLIAGSVFLRAKIRYEEQRLSARYPAYADYCQRVRWRCVPGLF